MVAMSTELPNDLVTVREAASAAGVTEKDVRNWLSARKLPRYRRGDFWVYVSMADVQRIAEERRTIRRVE